MDLRHKHAIDGLSVWGVDGRIGVFESRMEADVGELLGIRIPFLEEHHLVLGHSWEVVGAVVAAVLLIEEKVLHLHFNSKVLIHHIQVTLDHILVGCVKNWVCHRNECKNQKLNFFTEYCSQTTKNNSKVFNDCFKLHTFFFAQIRF